MIKIKIATGKTIAKESFEYDGPLILAAVDGTSGAGGPDSSTAKEFMERERSVEEKKKCEDLQKNNRSQEKTDKLKKEIEREISLVKYTGYKSSNLEKLIDEYRTSFLQGIGGLAGIIGGGATKKGRGIAVDFNMGMGIGPGDAKSIADTYGFGFYLGTLENGYAQIGAYLYKQRTKIHGAKATVGVDFTHYYNASAEEVFDGITEVRSITAGIASHTGLYNKNGEQIGSQYSIHGSGGGAAWEEGTYEGTTYPLQ
jgi:hypothetical protein